MERNESLCTIARHNFRMLGMDNAAVVNADSSDVAFIEGCRESLRNSSIQQMESRLLRKGLKTLMMKSIVGCRIISRDLPKCLNRLLPKPIMRSRCSSTRREADSYGRKMVSIRDCEPDVLALLPALSRFHVDAHTETLANARLA